MKIHITFKYSLTRAGIILVKDFILQLKLIDYFEFIPDNRNPIRILYSLSEELTGIILRILDGENRLSHQQGDKNSSMYQQLYNVKKEPHFTTLNFTLFL